MQNAYGTQKGRRGSWTKNVTNNKKAMANIYLNNYSLEQSLGTFAK